MNDDNLLKNNRILVIDDNPSIHEDFRKILAGGVEHNRSLEDVKALLFDEAPAVSARVDFEIDSAFQGEEGLRKVRAAVAEGRPYALAFVDVRMPPGWDGVETIVRIWEDHPDLQVVVCTAYSDYSWERMIEQVGKSDSLVILKKPFDNIEVLQLAHAMTRKWALNQELEGRLNNLDQLVSQRTRELESANQSLRREIAERLQTEKALRLSDDRFSRAFKSSPIPLAIQSLLQSKYVDVNDSFLKLLGYTREEVVGRTPDDLCLWAEPGGGKAILRKLHEEMSVRQLPCALRAKSGQMRHTFLSIELFELDGEPFLLTIAQDMTEQTQLEEQLRQSQKLEAIGQLAAGVAHDFNNILTVMQGYASLLLEGKDPDSKDYKPLTTIQSATLRASTLVRQLLTFSRKQVMQACPLDSGKVISTIQEMLPRLLGEHITVKLIVPEQLPPIKADASMMEQLLMNLAVNARDAMPQGGLLTLQAEEWTITPEAARANSEARPGRFVRFTVNDTGCGIAPAVLPRIFEPFFTTKGVGKGTGLGLATVYGIAKQHRGWIEVQSQVGQGSTFRALIPVAEFLKPATSPVPAIPHPERRGSETILLVEDENDVRGFVAEMLKLYGYRVLAAGSASEALELWTGHQKEVDLLFTDLVMPGGTMGGQLAERLVAEKPGLKVLYTSGYSPGMSGNDAALFEADNFLPKPYGPGKLLQALRRAFDGGAPAGGEPAAHN